MDMKRDRLYEIMDLAEIGNDQLNEGYSGRGQYGRKAPAISTVDDLDPSAELYRFMVAAGIRQAEMDADDDDGADFDAMDLAKIVSTDNMGKYGIVFSFPGLELTEGE